MQAFTPAQQSRALLILVAFHIAVIAASNYLVQFPLTVFGFHSTWGALTFPMIFAATDLTVRIYGSSLARKIILLVMMPAMLLSYLISVLFLNGDYQGLAGLQSFNGFVARIAIASFLAYALGQTLDVLVFNRLRSQKSWWVAPAASTVVGGAFDTLVFFAAAFHLSSDPFMAQHWPEIAAVDYVFKLFVSLLLFVPAYGLLMNRMASRLVPAAA